MLASVGDDQTLRVWNTQTWQLEQVLRHDSEYPSVVFSSDSTKLATIEGKHVHIWNTRTWECERILRGHRKNVRSVAFAHDGQMLVSVGEDQIFRVWHARTWKKDPRRGCSITPNSVTFSYDLTLMAVMHENGEVSIWRTGTWELAEFLFAGGRDGRSITFSPDSKMLATSSYGYIRVWNTENWDLIYERRVKAYVWWVTVTFSSDSKKMAVSDIASNVESEDNAIRIWNTDTWDIEQTCINPTDAVHAVAFSPNTHLLASGDEDGLIRIWTTATKESQLQGNDNHTSTVKALAFSPNLKKLLSASYDASVRIWNTETGGIERVLLGHTQSVWSAVFLSNQRVASASDDKSIRIWNIETGKCERMLLGHKAEVRCITYSDVWRKLASVSANTVRVWNTDTWRCEHVFRDKEEVKFVRFLPERKILTRLWYGKSPIWDLDTGACVRVLQDQGVADSWALSPDCTMFAFASMDLSSEDDSANLQIWDAHTYERLEVIPLPREAESMSFTRDGRGIITSSGTFSITAHPKPLSDISIPSRPPPASSVDVFGDSWVTKGGRTLFWLSAECRNGVLAVAGNLVAIGCTSGRVIILGFLD